MIRVGLIGGTGVDDWGSGGRSIDVKTRFGDASGPVQCFSTGGIELVFIPRHGGDHRWPPHRVNYRANIECLRLRGVSTVFAVNAVGGIASHMRAGDLVIPDQLIDYTWGRQHTFSEEPTDDLQHVEFARPFHPSLRKILRNGAVDVERPVHDGGCMGVTQGPRLETAAEIRRLRNDGCDLVGMTTMPEAALAAEAGLRYACLAVIANPAANEDEEPISMQDIEQTLNTAMMDVRRLLSRAIEQVES